MPDLVGPFKTWAAAVIEELRIGGLRLSFPVRVSLMDVSMVPFVELIVNGPIELGLRSIDAKPLPGTLWKKGPYTAKFIAEGVKPFTRDFSWSPEPAL